MPVYGCFIHTAYAAERVIESHSFVDFRISSDASFAMAAVEGERSNRAY